MRRQRERDSSSEAGWPVRFRLVGQLPISSPFLAALLVLLPLQEPSGTTPGAIPAETPPEARASWEAMVAAAFPDGPSERVTCFDFECWGTAYTGGRQANDFEARIRFLEPGFVHRTMKRSGRGQVRGPAGDFLIDEKGRVLPLQGREYAEDRKDLDRTVAVARTFVALTDPLHLTIASLELQPAAPTSLPGAFAARAAELTWLVVRSPDFYLADAAEVPAGETDARPLYRVQLGLDRTTKLPELVVIQRDDPGQVQLAQLVQLKKFKTLDGHRVPFEVRTFDPDLRLSPWKFGTRPATLLGINQGSLRPDLTAKDFEPGGG